MEDKNQLESGFRIQNILLLESSFNRIQAVEFENPDIKQDVDVNLSVSINENIVAVEEKVTYKQIIGEVTQVTAIIRMVGVFEKFGDSPLDLEQFGNVNAAAIIFPYIREHLTGLAAKAGLGLIFLPPVNLTKKSI